MASSSVSSQPPSTHAPTKVVNTEQVLKILEASQGQLGQVDAALAAAAKTISVYQENEERLLKIIKDMKASSAADKRTIFEYEGWIALQHGTANPFGLKWEPKYWQSGQVTLAKK